MRGLDHQQNDSGGSLRRRARLHWERNLALILVAIALWIRSYGLSHDFELGKIYHPDTPKQVHAARRFSAGMFYRKTGDRDIDGYPFFTSLIAAGIYRAAQGTAETAARHLGLRYDAKNLWREPRAVEWIMRWLNVLLSSFAVWLLFSLARRFSPGPFALLPAALFCFSPLDVAACHYASGDTAAAFFGLIALLFSLRILDCGGALDYMVASAACVCSFSAKYHGGMLAFPLMVAHALRVRSFRALFAPASIRRVLLVLTTVIVVFFLTNPSTLVRTSDAFRDIFNFIFKAGRKGVLGIPRHSAWSPHFLLAKFTINAPVLAEFMSPVLLAFACVGIVLALLRVEKPRIVLATLPVAYALFGLSPKTADNPTYSTLVTPALFLLGTLALRDLARCRILAPLPRLSAPAFAITAAAMLINATAREMFFFWHRDTRVLASAWIRENVPVSFEVTGGPYSLLDPDLSVRSEPFSGSAFVRSAPRTPVPEGTFPVCTIWLEDKPLPLFRNFTTTIYLRSPWIREGWTLPVYQKIPSSLATELILADGDEFWRSPRLFSIYPKKPLKKTVFSQRRLKEIVVRVRCGPSPTWCDLEIGGQTLRHFLEADAQKYWLIRNPRVGFPFLKKGYLYHCRAAARDGEIQVELAFQDEAKGTLLFSVGAYGEALPYLHKAASHKPNPGTAIMADLAAALGRSNIGASRPSLAAGFVRPRQEFNEDEVFKTCGLAVAYLNALPYIMWDAAQLERQRSDLAPSSSEPSPRPGEKSTTYVLRSPPVMLERGCYTAAMTYQLFQELLEPLPITVRFKAADGSEALTAQTLLIPPGATGTVAKVRFDFAKPRDPSALQLHVEVPATTHIAFQEMTIQPDVTATLNGLLRAWKAIASEGEPSEASSPDNFDLLLSLGTRLEREGQMEGARTFYLAAAQACPGRLEPPEALARLLPRLTGEKTPAQMLEVVDRYRKATAERREVPVHALFAAGLKLKSVVLIGKKVKPGGVLLLKTYWDVSKLKGDRNLYAVWVHFVDSAGRIVFQGDHMLSQAVYGTTEGKRYSTDGFVRVPIPAETPPGQLKTIIGVWLPNLHKVVPIRKAALPVLRQGIEVATLEIVEQS